MPLNDRNDCICRTQRVQLFSQSALMTALRNGQALCLICCRSELLHITWWQKRLNVNKNWFTAFSKALYRRRQLSLAANNAMRWVTSRLMFIQKTFSSTQARIYARAQGGKFSGAAYSKNRNWSMVCGEKRLSTREKFKGDLYWKQCWDRVFSLRRYWR